MAKKTDFITFDYIVNYCDEHNELEWLAAETSRQAEQKEYPKKKVTEVNEAGEVVEKTIADKSQEPIMVMKPITFVQVKADFIDKFMPELKAAKKPKKPTMFDIVKARIAAKKA